MVRPLLLRLAVPFLLQGGQHRQHDLLHVAANAALVLVSVLGLVTRARYVPE